jgi:Protein of unknown function (DUF2690)
MTSLIRALRTRGAAVVIAAVTFAALFAAAPAASAFVPGPPCDGHTCVGKTPYTVNRQGISCVNDAVDVSGSTVIGSGDGLSNSVTLRWSAYCQANWARYNDPSNLIYAHFYVQTYDGHIEWPHGDTFTYMVDGTQLARACVKGFTVSYYTCSNWF